jgi:hypothetical protein
MFARASDFSRRLGTSFSEKPAIKHHTISSANWPSSNFGVPNTSNLGNAAPASRPERTRK